MFFWRRIYTLHCSILHSLERRFMLSTNIPCRSGVILSMKSVSIYIYHYFKNWIGPAGSIRNKAPNQSNKIPKNWKLKPKSVLWPYVHVFKTMIYIHIQIPSYFIYLTSLVWYIIFCAEPELYIVFPRAVVVLLFILYNSIVTTKAINY